MARRINKFFVNDHYLALAAEAIRVYSVQSKRFETYSSTVEHGCALLLQSNPTRDQLQRATTLSERGSNPVILAVTDEWQQQLRSAAALAREVAGKMVFYPTVSALVLMCVVDTAENT